MRELLCISQPVLYLGCRNVFRACGVQVELGYFSLSFIAPLSSFGHSVCSWGPMTSSAARTSLQGPCWQKRNCHWKQKRLPRTYALYLVLPLLIHITLKMQCFLMLPVFLQLNSVFIKDFSPQTQSHWPSCSFSNICEAGEQGSA